MNHKTCQIGVHEVCFPTPKYYEGNDLHFSHSLQAEELKEILELRQNITKKNLSKQLSRDRMSYQPPQWVFHCEIWGRFILLCWLVFNSTHCLTRHEEHYGVQKCARSLASTVR